MRLRATDFRAHPLLSYELVMIFGGAPGVFVGANDRKASGGHPEQ
jgi:hypothetical protein